MEFFLDEDIELIKKLKNHPKFDIKGVLNRKKLSDFELDIIMNGK